MIQTRFQANTPAARSRLAGQVRYVGRAGLFDGQLAAVPLAEARTRLAAHALPPDWEGPIAYHRIVLSLRAGAGLDDPALLRLLVAVGLDDLGRVLDRRPVFVAGVHADTSNLHAHVLLAGGDERGRSVEIRPHALAAVKDQIEDRALALAGH